MLLAASFCGSSHAQKLNGLHAASEIDEVPHISLNDLADGNGRCLRRRRLLLLLTTAGRRNKQAQQTDCPKSHDDLSPKPHGPLPEPSTGYDRRINDHPLRADANYKRAIKLATSRRLQIRQDLLWPARNYLLTPEEMRV